MNINDLQTLLYAGKLLDAIELVENLRLSSVELQATIEQKLADTRRDIKSVDWHSEGEMDSLLKEANNRISQNQPILDALKDEIRLRLDNLDDAGIRKSMLEDPKRKEYYQLEDLSRTLDNCYLAHVRLLNPLIGARSVFLDEQLRQDFSYATQAQ